MASPGKDSAAELFAAELKACRAARGWTQAETARRVNYSESTIASVETCRLAASADLARALDRLFATPGYSEDPPAPGTFGRLAAKIGDAAFSTPFGEFAVHERTAGAVFAFQHSVLPGLLQTEDYALDVLSHWPNVSQDVISSRLAGRMERQRVIMRDDSPLVAYFMVDEQALYREIGGPKVMGEALAHVAEMMDRPNVTVQVVPRAGYHPGLLGSFDIAETEGMPTVVNCEDIADGRVTDSPAVVSVVLLRYRYVASLAYPVGASRDIILRAADRYDDHKRCELAQEHALGGR